MMRIWLAVALLNLCNGKFVATKFGSVDGNSTENLLPPERNWGQVTVAIITDRNELMRNMKKFQLLHSAYPPDQTEFSKAVSSAQAEIERVKKAEEVKYPWINRFLGNGLQDTNSEKTAEDQDEKIKKLESHLIQLKAETDLEKAELECLKAARNVPSLCNHLQKAKGMLGLQRGKQFYKLPYSLRAPTPVFKNYPKMPSSTVSTAASDDNGEVLTNINKLIQTVESGLHQDPAANGPSSDVASDPKSKGHSKGSTSHKLFLLLPSPSREKRSTMVLADLEKDLLQLRDRIISQAKARQEMNQKESRDRPDDMLVKVKISVDSHDSSAEQNQLTRAENEDISKM